MELLGEKPIAAISEALTQRLLERFHLEVSSLVFDCTNFDTFIDTENPANYPSAVTPKANAATSASSAWPCW